MALPHHAHALCAVALRSTSDTRAGPTSDARARPDLRDGQVPNTDRRVVAGRGEQLAARARTSARHARTRTRAHTSCTLPSGEQASAYSGPTWPVSSRTH